MRVRVLRAEARTTSVPAEVMQLIIVARKIHLADDLAKSGRMLIDINNAYGVAFPVLADVQRRKRCVPARPSLPCRARGKRLDPASRTYPYSPFAKVTAMDLAPTNVSHSVTRGRQQSATQDSRDLWEPPG